jgi:hypothetical protein
MLAQDIGTRGRARLGGALPLGSGLGSTSQPCVHALKDPAGYAVAFPDCDRWLADCDWDGWITALDIEPFAEVLVGGH